MKTPEDEAFEDIERRQGGGFPAKRAMAADKQRERVLFPTMLRKMWSGSEVQAWLDENVNKENT